MAAHTSAPSEAFARLLTANQARLYAFVFALVAEPHLAHDVFQESNRVLWEQAGSFDPERDFLPWAFAIARNQVRAARQRHRRERLTFDENVVDRIADRMAARARHLDERQVALAGCLQRLSEHQRQLVQRRYADGERVGDIATSQSLSANVVAVTLFRIRQILADCIRAALRQEEQEATT